MEGDEGIEEGRLSAMAYCITRFSTQRNWVFTTHAMTNMYYLYQNARYGPTTRPLYLFSFLAKMALILAQTNLGLWAASTGFQIPVFL